MTRRWRHGLFVAATCLGALAAVQCQVRVPEDAIFSCRQDSDCGGDGFRCVPGDPAGVCCKPAEEICDDRDNDCDGAVDEIHVPCYLGPAGTDEVGVCKAGERTCQGGTWGACKGDIKPQAELCNGLDDDCDRLVDEGFDLAHDPFHCGRCGNTCPAGQACSAGVCKSSLETQCGDGADNDGDLLLDCADFDCEGQTCGPGCACAQGARHEADCGDSSDNDADLLIDCDDADCQGRACGTGCLCKGAIRSETNCFDGLDNDRDVAIDCADPDCVGLACQPPPSTQTCTPSGDCRCDGGTPQGSEASCADGVDNDCVGGADCLDLVCDQKSCLADGGSGCRCKGRARTEGLCDNLADDDADGLADCQDSADCPAGTPCKYISGGNALSGTCQPGQFCH